MASALKDACRSCSIPNSAEMSRSAATLLFCHGGGFCKETWEPIMRRLRQAPVLQGVAADMVNFDFPYHGTRRNVSEAATVHGLDPKAQRVTHPAMHWPDWTPQEVMRQVEKIRTGQAQTGKSTKTPLIGIGHSMGAGALWIAEARNPGTFDGLVLFEPMMNITDLERTRRTVDFLVEITLQRRGNWDSMEEAEEDIMTTRNFARWHPELKQCYAKGAVVKVSPDNNVMDPQSKFALSCHPLIEASLYCGDIGHLTREEITGVRCPVTFQYGGRTYFFDPKDHAKLLKEHPHIYRLAEPVPNTTHTLVMEDPDTCTSRIVECLEKLPVFNGPSAPRASL